MDYLGLRPRVEVPVDSLGHVVSLASCLAAAGSPRKGSKAVPFGWATICQPSHDFNSGILLL